MGKSDRQDEGLPEIPLVGDLTENESDWTEKLLGVEPGGECILYFDSMGGCPYGAIALMSLILLRGLKATGVVTGECSSAALWPFAACRRRLVSPLSILLFHRMKWQSEENVGLSEASEWARHFGRLETDMDLPPGRPLQGRAGKDRPLGPRRPLRRRGASWPRRDWPKLIELKPLDSLRQWR